MKTLMMVVLVTLIINVNVSAANLSGFALTLDGDGDFVDFGNISQANFDTSAFTIECWVKKFTSRVEALISKREVCSHSVFWTMRPTTNANIEIDQNGANYLIRSGNKTINDSMWHHIVVTREGPLVSFYTNGLLDTTYSSGGTTNISNAASVFIGNSPCIGSSDGTKNFTGQVDEVRIWNVARNLKQIQQTFTDTLGSEYYLSADSGLVAYWRFDELEDLGINEDGVDDVRDFSIYANHGDLNGDAALIDADIPTSIQPLEDRSPGHFHLYQNYPNPFNPMTNIKFTVPSGGQVKIQVYNTLGQIIKTITNRHMPAGSHEVTFDARSLPSGIYLYRIESGGNQAVKKMILIK